MAPIHRRKINTRQRIKDKQEQKMTQPSVGLPKDMLVFMMLLPVFQCFIGQYAAQLATFRWRIETATTDNRQLPLGIPGIV